MNYSKKSINLDELYDDVEDNNKSAHLRGAAMISNEGASGFTSSTKAPAKENLAVSDNRSTLALWTPQHVAFLDQHIFLGKSAEAQQTFDFINQELADLSEGYQNFRVFPEEYKTIGYFLDETREGCYRIQMFTYNDKLGVNCTRLDGDSLALCSLWKNLKERLHEEEYYVDEFLADGDMEDDEDIFGDDEDDLDLDSFKYLDFSRDESFVSKMVDDVTDPNVGTHALMLLKFNFQQENNLQFVVDKFAQNLFDKTVDRLSGPNLTLPAAVCAAHILSCLVAQAAIAITADNLSSIIDAVEQWCSESNPSETIVPTASEEAAFKLTELLPTALEQVSENTTELDIPHRLQRLIKKTDFETVKKAAGTVLGSN